MPLSPPKPTDIISQIGNTPMLPVTRMDTGKCELFLKLENQNPGGSIKDRIGLFMVEAAEREGLVKPGGTLVEGTAGNTGLGLALVAAQKGYKLLLVIPDKMSQEKIFHLKAMGAEIVMTRSDVDKGHPEYYQDYARRLADEREGAHYVNQFGNPNNPRAHEETTGPEIWEQLDHRVDAIVLGTGTGGTLTGVGRFFSRVSPATEMIVADPVGSIVADMINTGKAPAETGKWLIEGIGEDYVPETCDLSFASRGISVDDKESFDTVRLLLRREGVLAGTSSGCLIAAALHYCREQTEPKRVVTFVCDTGGKYLSKAYNDYWMMDQGFIERQSVGDLRDLISRRSDDRAVVTTKPDDSLLAAFGRMKLYDISQLPVIDDNGELVGIVDELDIMNKVTDDEAKFSLTVKEAMVTSLIHLRPDAPLRDLLPIFDRGMVVIVKDDDHFYGIITRIDLLGYLRAKLRSSA